MQSFFTPAAKAEIAEAVTAAEMKTSGEIVPMIVRRSGAYKETSFFLATGLGLVFPVWLAFGSIWISHPAWVVLSFIPGWIAGYALGYWAPVKRLLVSRERMREKAKQRAFLAFHSNGLHETAGRTGILIFISHFEHEAVVLADKGIHGKVPEGTWDEILGRMLAEFRAGHPTTGVCKAVRECGEVLAKHFPATHNNPDEIPNRIWIEE